MYVVVRHRVRCMDVSMHSAMNTDRKKRKILYIVHIDVAPYASTQEMMGTETNINKIL